jgi:3-oxoacyl-[acyl-carrier-protein] synthase-3
VPEPPATAATITAVARSLPDKVVTNLDLESVVNTSDAWIRERTGIGERRILEDAGTSTMATAVARDLLQRSQTEATDVDLIIVATMTPDMMLPSTACLVQAEVGATQAWAFDLQAACSGFVYALVTGAQFISNGMHRRVMVIGADKMSAVVDPTDRATCVLFGDGAGGVLLEPASEPGEGLVDFELHADGTGCDDLCIRAGGSLLPASAETVAARQHYLHQEGRAVYKFAVQRMAEVSLSLLKRNGLSPADLTLFVPHQANQRIISATAERMGLEEHQVLSNIERYANTTAGTVPIALSEAVETGRVATGDLVQLTAVGGGLTWGSALLRWGQAV